MKARICIIGVGNEQRGDDAIGLHAARAIADRQLPCVDVFEAGDDATALIELWAGAEIAYVIDAIRCGHGRGCVHRFEPPEAPLPQARFSASSHTIGLAEAVELARTLDILPQTLVVFAVEGERFEVGSAPSGRALSAADEAAHRILAEINSPQGQAEVPHA